MNADDSISIDTLHENILAAIAGKFPDIRTVEDYPDDRRRVRVPAALVELVELAGAPDDDPGTGQLALQASFELRYVIGFRGHNQGRAIRSQIATLAHFIHHNQWDLPVEPAMVTACEPDEFSPELDQYVVWRIDWTQLVVIGENEWMQPGTTPETVWVGIAPDIGPEHVDDYTRVAGEEPTP